MLASGIFKQEYQMYSFATQPKIWWRLLLLTEFC